jgi:hypothetical protein
MRMEMPERYNDVKDGPLVPPFLTVAPPRPALSRAYLARYNANTHPRKEEYGGAECLYMFVTTGDSRARKLFKDSEIGDVDGDGLPEFVDGWGNPIRYLRWAPAFNDSGVQANIIPPSQTATVGWTDPIAVNNKQVAAENDHDPFDPMLADAAAWRLVPLVYSAGPDGIYDLNIEGSGYHFNGDPYAEDVGLPMDGASDSVTNPSTSGNGSLDHYDNIHNHRIEAR